MAYANVFSKKKKNTPSYSTVSNMSLGCFRWPKLEVRMVENRSII